jgi:hypothetical protein
MKAGRDEAQNVFRQFAWNLAGKLAPPKPPPRPKPRPAR